jgi:hypothetical protein
LGTPCRVLGLEPQCKYITVDSSHLVDGEAAPLITNPCEFDQAELYSFKISVISGDNDQVVST